MKTAVIYARYSSERQTEQSIEGQIRVCNEYANRNDLMIVDTYIDRAMSGTNDNRNDFQRMLRDSNKRAWDYVLVYKLDRFSRNKYEMAMHKRTLRDNGIKLLSAMENIPDTPEGIILESLLEGMAEYYSAELSQKVKRGMRESRSKGQFTGGFVPYGFKIVNKKVVIAEEEADIVRLIYERYAEGVYIKEIIKELHEKGISNRGKPFAKTTMHRILQNEKYAGVYHYKGELFDNIYPRIVSDELFNIVAKKNKDNQYGGRPANIAYILRKKVKCGLCGRPMNGFTGTSKSGKVMRYYSCAGMYNKLGCNKKSIRKELLEEIVVEVLQKAFSNSVAVSKLADDLLETNKKRVANNSILTLLTKEQEEVNKSIENILIAIEKGVVTNSTTKRLQTLESRQQEIAEKILMEESKEKMQISKKDIIEFIKKVIKSKPDKIVKLLVKEIILYEDKAEIICNYTNEKGPNDTPRQDLLFYTDIIDTPYKQEDTEAKFIIEAKA